MSGKIQAIRPGNGVLNAIAKVVPVLLAIFLAGAVVYYKQRMLFIDAPHVFFRVVNDGRLHIEEHRYGSFITQMFPLLGSWLHIPFRLLVILYSASFYIFYLTVALLLVYKFRTYSFAILLGMYFTLFVSEAYYWPNNEVHQGITWLMLAFGLNFYIVSKKWPLVVMALLFATSFYLAIWTHPLVMLVAVYLWFFLWFGKTDWPYSKTESFIFTGILLAVVCYKYYQGSSGGYDGTKIEIITQFQPAKIRSVFSSPQWGYFIKGCVTNYWLFVLVFFAGIAGLIYARKFLLLLWTLLFAAGYLLLLCITFWDLNSYRFYIESEYMPLSIICAAPFVYYVLPKLRTKTGVVIMVLIVSVRLGYIYNAAPAFTNRVAIMDKIINKMKEKGLTKVIIPEPTSIDSALIMNWGAPVESIFLSKLKGDKPQRTFIFVPADMLRFTTSIGKDTLLGCWEKRTVKNMNANYFQVDTASDYHIMSYSALME